MNDRVLEVKTKIKTTTTTENTLTLTGTEIVSLLRVAKIIPSDVIPEVCFSVPGGGDWSHMDVDITSDNPVYICWKTKESSCMKG